MGGQYDSSMSPPTIHGLRDIQQGTVLHYRYAISMILCIGDRSLGRSQLLIFGTCMSYIASSPARIGGISDRMPESDRTVI